MRQTGGQRVVAWLVAGLVFAWALPSWAQSWSYRRETDEMTDRTNHFASVRVGSGFRPAVFFAACRNDDLEMWLAPNDYIGSSDDNGPQTSRDDSRIYIDYRVNDEPAQEGRLANLSTDEDAFFFQDHADIIRGLLGKRLIVKWRDYRGTSTTLTIPTRGAAAALKKLPCARPYIPNCGDGETQLGEECDEGRKNSNERGAVCRRDCTYAPAVCGDGAVQHDEACDSGVPLASDVEFTCTSDCARQSIYAQLRVPCAGVPARIIVGEKEVGECDSLIEEVLPGEHEVIRRAPGFQDAKERVTFAAAQLVELSVSPASLLLTITDADASIIIDGKSYGFSAGKQERFELAPGYRKLVVAKMGFATFIADLRLNAGSVLEESVSLRPGTGIVVGSKIAGCPDGFARIAPGQMMMGSPPDEPRRDIDERRYAVTVAKAFCMSRTEITYGMWRALIGPDARAETDCGDDCPVANVSWIQASAFADAMSRRDGLEPCYGSRSGARNACAGYRLPSETEWEFAARAGDDRARYGELDDIAWHIGNTNRIHEVASKRANAFGLYDVLGNAAEWTETEYATTPVTTLSRFSDIRNIVVRGGSYLDNGGLVRAAARASYAPSFRAPHIGFRLVRDAD